MNWFILFGVVIVVSIIALILMNKYEYRVDFDFTILQFVSITLLIISITASLFTGLSLIGIETDFNKVKNEYESTKVLVQDYNAGDYGNAPALMEKVIDINSVIAKHKAKYDNNWTNLWNSEEIGNLEPLVFGGK